MIVPPFTFSFMPMTPAINIDTQRCAQCGRCVQVCPSSVFSGTKDSAIQVLRPEYCIQCGHCVDVCSTNALIHGSFPAEKVHYINYSLLPTPSSLMELIRSRRSNRTFTDTSIPKEIIQDILEAARYAPTAENSRKVKISVLHAEQIQLVEDATMNFFLRLSRILMNPIIRPITRLCLPNLYHEAPELSRFETRWKAGERPCTCNAVTLLVFSAPKGYDFGWQDCNLAYQNASLMAQAHGVSQVYMGLVQSAFKYMSSSRVSCLLHLPKKHQQYAIMALGFPALKYGKYTER